jgi:hypothetical protein
VIIYFFIVETRYTPLEEIAKFFDGDAVDVAEIANAEMKESKMRETDKAPQMQHQEIA